MENDIPHDHGPHVHYNHQVFPFKYKVIICHTFFLILTILAIFNKIPDGLANPDERDYVKAGFLGFAGCFAVFTVLSFSLKALDRKRQSGEVERRRRDLMIGYGAIVFYGLISEFVVLVMGDHVLTWTIVSVCYLTPLFLIPLFIFPNLLKYQIATPWKNVFYLKLTVFLAHSLFCIITVIFVAEFAQKENATTMNLLTFLYTCMYTFSSMEFSVIWSNGIRYEIGRRKTCKASRRGVFECRVCGPVCDPIQVQEIELETLQVHLTIDGESGSENQNPNTPTCGICMEKFSATVIPRILVECEHTVCEECIKKIMYFELEDKKVKCPFCMVVSGVPDGKPKQLPKNERMLEEAVKELES